MLLSVEEIIKYEYKMCLHSDPGFILAYQITQVPSGFEYTLSEVGLKMLWDDDAPMMTTKTLGLLLSAFVGVVHSCKEYLLNFEHVALEGGTFNLRVDGTVGFSYRPFSQPMLIPLRQRLETWLALVHQHVDSHSEEAMTMLHPLGIALASESLNLKDIAEVIESSLGHYYA